MIRKNHCGPIWALERGTIFRPGRIGVRPFVRAAWEHEFKESRLPISVHLVDIPSPPITLFGPSLGHDSAVVNAGVAVQWTPSFSTYVSYDGSLVETGTIPTEFPADSGSVSELSAGNSGNAFLIASAQFLATGIACSERSYCYL
jgi:hypothetical protein